MPDQSCVAVRGLERTTVFREDKAAVNRAYVLVFDLMVACLIEK